MKINVKIQKNLYYLVGQANENAQMLPKLGKVFITAPNKREAFKRALKELSLEEKFNKASQIKVDTKNLRVSLVTKAGVPYTFDLLKADALEQIFPGCYIKDYTSPAGLSQIITDADAILFNTEVNTIGDGFELV